MSDQHDSANVLDTAKVPPVVDRAIFQAQLDALRIQELVRQIGHRCESGPAVAPSRSGTA
jgi:hypothetical protein